MLHRLHAPRRSGVIRCSLPLSLIVAVLGPGCFDPVQVPQDEEDPIENWSWGSGGYAGWELLWPDQPLGWPHGDPYPFLVFAPEGYSNSIGRPLLVLLHDGTGGGYYTPEGGWTQDAVGGWSTLANAEKFLLAVPGISWGSLEPHHWGRDDQHADYVELTMLQTMARYNVDLDRTYLAGLGLGGVVGLDVILDDDTPWASLSLHAPDPGDVAWDIPLGKQRRPLPVLVTHHPYDAVVDIEQSRDLVRQLDDEGYRASLVDELGELPDDHHGIDPQVAAILWDFARAHTHAD